MPGKGALVKEAFARTAEHEGAGGEGGEGGFIGMGQKLFEEVCPRARPALVLRRVAAGVRRGRRGFWPLAIAACRVV